MSRCRFLALAVIAGLLTITAYSTASAQTQVEISRPLDGATVRETVNILVPVSSVPIGGFVSCIIDDNFRAALATKTEDEDHFVFRWDTKAEYVDPNNTAAPAVPSEGEHTITVDAYDSSGRKIGEPKRITVYVNNNASNAMPAEGLKLRYNRKINTVNNIKFTYTLDLKTIQGGRSIGATVGESVEGATGVVRRTVEDMMQDDTALIRQRLTGQFQTFQSGRPTPVNLPTRSVYQTEDSTGRITYIMKSNSPGAAVALDMPKLPAQRVRIGDSWSHPDKVFRDVTTGQSVTLAVTSTLEGLEWEQGYRCAKIRTLFSGSMPIPFSRYFTDPVDVTEGETITYFAYEIGKMVSSTTTAKAKTTVSNSVVSSLTQSLLPQGISYNPTPQPTMMTPAPSMGIGGPPGMEGVYPGATSSPAPAYGATSDSVQVELVINQRLEPAT